MLSSSARNAALNGLYARPFFSHDHFGEAMGSTSIKMCEAMNLLSSAERRRSDAVWTPSS
jgi:hypothetical protein